MLITLYILSGLIIFQLILPFITVFLSRWTSGPVLPENGNAVADYACIITAYKNAAIAAPLVQSLIRQSYPHFHIYLVADECPPVTIPAHPSVTVLEPSGPLRLKARSIIYAMEHLVRPHQYIVIFDADNLAHPDFLKETDRYVTAGFTCIQGERTAKNTDNNFAAAD